MECKWCQGKTDKPVSLQEAIAYECHRWKHQGRWLTQAQAVLVANQKWSKREKYY